MKTGERIHGNWRNAFGYRFLSSDDFETGKEVTLTIAAVTHEQAYDKATKQQKPMVAVSFHETDRLLALNATNAKEISVIAGSPMTDKWTGLKITVYRIEDKFFGRVGALRVKQPGEINADSATA